MAVIMWRLWSIKSIKLAKCLKTFDKHKALYYDKGSQIRLPIFDGRKGENVMQAIILAAGYATRLKDRAQGRAKALMPVSYTHLDVYKRQGHRRSRIDDGLPTAGRGGWLRSAL